MDGISQSPEVSDLFVITGVIVNWCFSEPGVLFTGFGVSGSQILLQEHGGVYILD